MNEIFTTEHAEHAENEESSLTGKIIGAAIDVHRALGPGYRADLVVEGRVIVEIKSVANIASVHEAQLLSYLKLSDCKYGLLINFNVKLLKDGIRRFKA
jgi:PD-(D/E)XK nuclease superfamily